MKLERALKIEEDAHKRRMAIRSKKSHDYANDDCLSNFKVMGDLEAALRKHGYGIPVDKSYGVAFWHVLYKMVRILNLWNEEVEPENESLQDTHDDLANYNNLAYECFIDYIEEYRRAVSGND